MIDASKFSLEYLRPSGAGSTSRGPVSSFSPPVSAADPWNDIVKHFGPKIQRVLQKEGQKQARDILEKYLTESGLDLKQLYNIIYRMYQAGQVTLIPTKEAETYNPIVALPTPR